MKSILTVVLLSSPVLVSTAQDQMVQIRVAEVVPLTFLGETVAYRDWDDGRVFPDEVVRDERGLLIERDEHEGRKERMRRNPDALPQGADPAWQSDPASRPQTRALDLTQNGQGYTNLNPSDNVLDVGPNHVIQMINGSSGSRFQVFDKTGASLGAAVYLDNFVGSAGGAGDPVVLYDALADRWLMSEFASSGNHLLVAVSTTADPTGSWYAYDFTTADFPDYPKYGVWNNMYTVTTNESNPKLYALDRTKMLAGLAATAQVFNTTSYPGVSFEACAPVTHDGGSAPPAGAPALFMRMADDGWGAAIPYDRLDIWTMTIDWVTPANSVVSGPTYLPTTAFDSGLCGYTSFSCIDQPGTSTNLDPLREILMNRVQYRNFGSHESIVCDHAVDVSGSDRAGIRWYELRRTGGIANPWSIHQQGTWSPDTDSRWLGAIAINANGDIGLAYNVSSSTVYPSVRYTGRYATDPPGTMTFAETSIVAGASYNGSNRYGDYNSLDVDPANGTIFWGTAQHNPTSQWSTRMFAFSFPAQTLALGAKVKLEGPFVPGSGLMSDDLRVAGLIPTAEPYSSLGYTYAGGGGGETAAPAVFATTGSNAIVDWVVVELRDPVTPAVIVAGKAALLQRDGDVVGVDGVSPLAFNQPAGTYHVAIRHRNHLGCMTNVPVALSGTLANVDFTQAATATYGTNARKNVSGTMVLWSGDVTFDHELMYTGMGNDRDKILQLLGGTVPTNTLDGYHGEDVNMNGEVKYTGLFNDRDPILVNIGGSVPTSTRNEQLP